MAALIFHPEPYSARRLPWAGIVWLLALWCGLTFWYTRANDFPWYYHNDEPSKAAQVFKGHRNFYHPQLLLELSKVTVKVRGGTRTPQSCAEAGRDVSAGLMAGAICLLSLLAWRLGGTVAVVGVAVLAGTHPMLFELAHYMKEDCAWLFGLSAFYLAANGLDRRRNGRHALWLGAASGLATSGKYIGILTLAAGLIFILCLRDTAPGQRWRWFGLVLLGFVASFAAINWMAFVHPREAWGGLREELEKIPYTAHHGGGSGWTQWRFLNKYFKFAWPGLALLAFGFAATFAWQIWHRLRLRATPALPDAATKALLILYPAAQTLLLLFSPRTYERYWLPVVGTHCLLAALAAAMLGAALGRRLATPTRHWAIPLTICIAALASLWQWKPLMHSWRDFHLDTRIELAEFLSTHVPEDEGIAFDSRTFLGEMHDRGLLPRRLLKAENFLAELGSVDEMLGTGYSWFVVDEENRSFMENERREHPEQTARWQACDAFYRTLGARGELVWQRTGHRISYLHPTVKVYHVRSTTDR